MRRPSAITVARDSRILVQVFNVLLAMFAFSGLIAMFSIQSRAQTPLPSCGEGLMRRNDTGTGELLFKTAIPGCYFPAPRVAADFAIDISGPVARTRVTQRFENPADGWVEGIYLFPLPDGAAVDTLKMKIGERLIEGQIKERGEARQIYETAKAEGKRASLVEQERPNIFTNSVANIGPHEIIVVQIEYQESLRFDAGRYHLRVPLVVAPRFNPRPSATLVQYREGAQFGVFDPVPDRARLEAPVLRPEAGKVNPVTFAMTIEAGFPLGSIMSDSHHILVVREADTRAKVALADRDIPADRDFVFSFAPRAGDAPAVSLLKEQKDGADYFLALIMPRANETRAATRAREAIFVLDNSGSMGGESIRQAKAGLLLALERLTPADRFNVIRFDDTMTQLYRRAVPATPENVAYAKGYVSNIEARGGTVMLPALIAALNDETPDDRTYLRQVIFLTDGAVGNEAELFAAIDQRIGRTRLFTIGIGSAPNSHFMSGAARAGRGTFTYIGSTAEVTARMDELFVKLERPVMTDLIAEWPAGAVIESWPNPLPDLYAGEPVVVTFKAEGSDDALLLKGNRDGAPWEVRLALSQAQAGSGIERLWARNKIAALEESRVLGIAIAEIDREVLNVALTHHLVSRLTSLVAVDVIVAREPGELLSSRQVPLNLPAGWDFDKVFGETAPLLERRADMSVPDTLLMKLDVNAQAPGAVRPQDAGLVLPQGATPAPLLLIAGFMLLLLAGTMLLRRRAEAGARLMRALRRLLVPALIASGVAMIASALYIPAKAALAQVLLERAWDRARSGEANAKPWPWADVSPVAVLEVPRLGERSIVLEGASGEAMAFGPGHMSNTPAIGAHGTAVIAAHRDTQFRYLRDVSEGERIVVETADGRRSAFRVVETRIVRADASGLDPDDSGSSGARLALVTCYPFDGVFRSPWRYVVLADRETPMIAASDGGRES